MATVKIGSPKKSPQQRANLRVCASCEWIFRVSDPLPQTKLDEGFAQGDCPQCQFVSYGARYVYRAKAYEYARTQKPWLEKKLNSYEDKLLNQIEKENPIQATTQKFVFPHRNLHESR